VSDEADLRECYRRIIEAIGQDDPNVLGGLLQPDLVDHNPMPDQAPGRDGFKQWMAAVRTTFPDLRGTVNDLLVAEDRVAARVTWRGTHRGDFAGVPATNRPVSFAAFHIVRFAQGRAAEWWGTADLLSALRQIGAQICGPDS
jgi:steroid delta-isomerase-like uncharacterized protein